MAGSAGTQAAPANSNPFGPYADVIWNDLIAMGQTPAQAAGWLANSTHEGSPENSAMDSNGYRAYGIFSFNSQYFKDAPSLVTGNPTQDIASQLNYLKAHNELGASTGATTPGGAAVQIANRFERCTECGIPGAVAAPFQGSSQSSARASTADSIYAYYTGNPAPATDTSGVTGNAQAAQLTATQGSSTPLTTATASGATAFFVEIDKFLQGNFVIGGGGGLIGALTGVTGGVIQGVMVIVDRAIGVILGAGMCYMGFKLISQAGSGVTSPGVVGTAIRTGIRTTATRGTIGVRAEATQAVNTSRAQAREAFAVGRAGERTEAASTAADRRTAEARQRGATRARAATTASQRRQAEAKQRNAVRAKAATTAYQRREKLESDRRSHQSILQGERLAQRKEEELRRQEEARRARNRGNTRENRRAS